MTGRRSSALDALRGLAITLVVAQHYWGLACGWMGVNLFFVLSGYLIGGILLDNRDAASNYFRTFYGRRVLRLIPMYAVFLAVTYLSLGLPLPLWQYAAFVQNFSIASEGVWHSPTTVTWSLAVEEQFYLVLPLLIRFIPPTALPKVLIAGVLTAPACRVLIGGHYGNPIAPYVLLPGQMDALFGGVLLAWLVRSGDAACDHFRPIWIASALAAVGVVMLGTREGFGSGGPFMQFIGYSLVDVVFAGFVLLATHAEQHHQARERVLSTLGIGAYSVYLFHTLIFALLPDRRIALALTALVAWASWIVIEKPCIRWARERWSYDRTGVTHKDVAILRLT